MAQSVIESDKMKIFLYSPLSSEELIEAEFYVLI